MAFFPNNRLKPRHIEIDRSTISAQSPEVQSRLQRIDANFHEFDELFADVQATIENDDQLREFNAHLKVADLEPKKKSRWRSRTSKRKPTASTSRSKTKPKSTSRSVRVVKAKNAQLNINSGAKKVTPSKKQKPR